jgi:hypothetical protein
MGVLGMRHESQNREFSVVSYHSVQERRIVMQKKRKNRLVAWLFVGVLMAGLTGPVAAQNKPPEDGSLSMSMPKVGEMAPDFSLKYFDSNDLKDVSLSQYRGKKNVVVAFFIFAFTGG